MPKPLDETKRAAILADIRTAQENGKSAGQIARDHGVARSSVTKIAKDEGLDDAFERAQTLKASRAKSADVKIRRAQLLSDLIDDAQRLRKRAWEPYEIPMSGPNGVETIMLDLPPLPDVRAAYTSIGIIVDKSVAVEKLDSGEDGVDQAKTLIGDFMSLAAAASGHLNRQGLWRRGRPSPGGSARSSSTGWSTRAPA